jgi:putative SOS response-associated peptidase YedK
MGVGEEDEEHQAVGRYNVAPTQQVAIIERTAEDDRHASTARWSLVPRWAKSIKERPQWINARSDKPSPPSCRPRLA